VLRDKGSIRGSVLESSQALKSLQSNQAQGSAHKSHSAKSSQLLYQPKRLNDTHTVRLSDCTSRFRNNA
jgi:hypothetical protein